MPSSPKIPKELILKTALQMLIRSGNGAITIQSVARELKSSTQPLSWQFGNMENFRAALAEKALEYAVEKTNPRNAGTAFAAFKEVGDRYLDLAFDEPHLFRFVFLEESGLHREFHMFSMLDSRRNESLLEPMMKEFNIMREAAEEFMRTMVVYAHGLATLAATQVMQCSREAAHRRLAETGFRVLQSFGVSRQTAEALETGKGAR